MTKEEFIEKCKAVYMIDSMDEDNEIEIIGRKKSEDECITFEDVVIIDLEADSCDIYRVFTYGDYDSLLTVREMDREKLLLMQALGKSYGILPELDFYDGMGCPFTDVHVGYFNVVYDYEKINQILGAFESAFALEENAEIDEEYLMHNFKSEYCAFLEYGNEIKYAYRMLMESGYSEVSERYPSRFGNIDNVFVDREGAFIAGYGDDSFNKMKKSMNFQTCKIEEIYFGENYCLAQSGELKVSLNSNYFKRINAFLYVMEIEDKDCLQYEISQNIMVVKTLNSGFWAIILALNGEQDIFAAKEYKGIQEMYNKLLPFISPELLHEEYNFSKLDDRAFEKMCRDLLLDMGFLNVIQRGNTRASDGGVDLEADMKVETIFGEQKQHWIFQCKHTKTQIDRKDISEIPDLLEEFKASGYGLFYSGMLSPQTLDRIKKKEFIIYWAKGELEILLRKYRNTAIRYFGI
ncbi:MAG: restriction endonuclease [Lachnospiraceae bacterium]|nr:restriction endonuclease [Lachnospiraceae bacterium]